MPWILASVLLYLNSRQSIWNFYRVLKRELGLEGLPRGVQSTISVECYFRGPLGDLHEKVAEQRFPRLDWQPGFLLVRMHGGAIKLALSSSCFRLWIKSTTICKHLVYARLFFSFFPLAVKVWNEYCSPACYPVQPVPRFAGPDELVNGVQVCRALCASCRERSA